MIVYIFMFRKAILRACPATGLVSVSNTRVFGLESGHFLALRRPQALCFGAFWRPGRAQAKGGCRLREMNRIESGVEPLHLSPNSHNIVRVFLCQF
jgi:hypothetical protein